MNKKRALLAMSCAFASALAVGSLAACGSADKEEAKEYTLDMQGVYAYAQEQGYTGTYEELIAAVKGDKGDQGAQGIQGTGIASIEKTATEDLVDTYTITFTDGSTTTFNVNNGEAGVGIASFDKAPVDGNELATEYTITYTDGTKESFIVTDGAKGDRGVGIKSIAEKERAEDGSYVVYTITYTNNDTFDFTVENGTIGKDGVSISDITPTVGTDADGNPCTIMTIMLTNETSYQISIPNGTKGDKGDTGVGVQTATIATNGDLVFTLTEGEPIVAGNILDLINAQGEMHTVKFGFYWGDDEVYDDEAYATVSIRDGGKLVDPLFGENKDAILDMIARDADGYEADGWYYLYNGELVEWSFFGYSVTEDMSLFYAEDINKKISYDLTYAGLEGANVYGALPTTYTKGDGLPSIAAYKLETETTEVVAEDGTPSTVETKYLSVFDGWVDAEGKEVTYLGIGGATLTANWRKVEYGYSDVDVTATAAYSGEEDTVIISGDDVTTWKGSFYNNKTAKNVYIIAPNLATINNSNAFKKMLACENVVIVSDALTAGKASMFEDSAVLQRVILECPNITKLENYSFRRCYALQQVKLPAACTVWGNGVFYGVTDFDVVENFGWDYLNTLTAVGSQSFYGNETFTEIRVDGTHFAALESYDGMFASNPNVRSIYLETYSASVSGSFNSLNTEKMESIYIYAPLATSFTPYLNNTKAESIYVYAPMATTLGTSGNLGNTNFETLIVTNDATTMPQANTAVYVVGALTETGALAGSSSVKKVIYDVPTLTTISNNAFNNAKALTSVQIVSGDIKIVGASAFGGCSELRVIMLPEVAEGTQYATAYYSYNDTYNYTGIQNVFSGTNKLEYLSNFNAFEEMFKVISGGSMGSGFAYNAPVFAPAANGFAYCGNTIYKAAVSGNVVIPADVEAIANNAFQGTEITSVSFAEGSQIKTIGESGFSGCAQLVTADMTNATALESMGQYVFAHCLALKNVTLSTSEKFTSIPKYAFTGNVSDDYSKANGIESIHIPANITSIEYAAFVDSRLSNFTVAEGAQITFIDDYIFQGTLFTDATEVLNNLAAAGVTNLTYGMFMRCPELTTVTIPASIKSMEDLVFDDCAKLTSFAFAEGTQIETIEYRILGGTALTTFTLPKSATTMPQFSNVPTLTSITFEEGSQIKELESFDNTQITEINIPSTVTTMGTFKNCTKLTSIAIPVGVSQIPASAFDGCTALETVTFAEGSALTRINNYAFRDTALKSIVIPAKVTQINTSVFENCTNLTTVKAEGVESVYNQLPEGLTTIGTSAFKNTAIESMVLPTTTSTLNATAFDGCTKLKYFSAPGGLRYNKDTFRGTALKTIKIVKSPSHAGISASATSATSTMKSYYTYAPWYVASNMGKVDVIIGEGITTLAISAFYGCNLDNMTIFVEGAEPTTINSSNDSYTDATKYVGLNTTWEYDAQGLPVVKTTSEEEVVA